MPQIPQEYQILGPGVGVLLDALYGFGNESTQAGLVTGGTITTQATPQGFEPGWFGTVIVNPAAAVTGAIFQPGVNERQPLLLVNNSANTITPAALATSNVLAGVARAIPANSCSLFVWIGSLNSGAGAWAQVG